MLRPWAETSLYRCIAVDIRHQGVERTENGIEYVGADISTYLPPLGVYAIVFGFPPCTDLAVSGARWFQEKGMSALHQAIGLVEACRRLCEWSEAPYLIENPVGTLSTYWRKPDHTFNPCDYAGYPGGENDLYTKKTCLWTGGGFIMPEKRTLKPVQGSRMHRLAPGPERADLRSETPNGFACAVFEANHPRLMNVLQFPVNERSGAAL